MAVKVIVDRRIKPRERQAALDLMREMRERCLSLPGYMGGETLRDNNDENHVVVISTWFGLMDWKRWYASQDRKDFAKRIEAHLREPEQVLVTLEGLSENVAGP
jgi:antibiotic biosynthesis monooxygenase (ABM) superfamily enzyme